MKSVIEMDLFSPDSVEKAISRIEHIIGNLDTRCDEIADEIANRIKDRAEPVYNSAAADVLEVNHQEVRVPANVNMTVTGTDGERTVSANGRDAMWAEFGAGVFYNGPDGIGAPDWAANLGWEIGGYGWGLGNLKVWVLPGGEAFSSGTPATSALYNATRTTEEEIPKIVREVLKIND